LFVKDAISQGRRPNLLGGGVRVSSNGRALGSADFVEHFLSEANERERDIEIVFKGI